MSAPKNTSKITKRSDRVVLSQLISSGKLSKSEEKAFRSMLESLDSGQLNLSASQRMWIEQVFDKLRLDTQPIPKQLVKSKTAKSEERRSEHPLDNLISNRPLKPPGKQ